MSIKSDFTKMVVGEAYKYPTSKGTVKNKKPLKVVSFPLSSVGYKDWKGTEMEGENLLMVHKDGTICQVRRRDATEVVFLYGKKSTAEKLAEQYSG